MAIFRFEAKIIGRRAKDKAGKPIPGRSVSVIAKAAYRAGEKLHDDRTDKTYNYRSRAQEVVHSEIVAPDLAPSWLRPADDDGTAGNPRERLWNEIERSEKRVDSQLAREFIIALPLELEREQQADLIRHWCQDQVTAHGYVADFAVHKSRDGNNPHAHILCTLRPVEGEGFGKKPDMSGKFNERGSVGAGAKSDLEAWRESWEIHCNEALERAGIDARIDHRSLKDQGIDREPEPKIGVDAAAMQRRGAVEDPERSRDARQVRMQNELRTSVRAIEATGGAPLDGETEATWSMRLRSSFAYWFEEARELMRDETSGPRRKPEKDGRETEQQATTSDAAAERPSPAWTMARLATEHQQPIDRNVDHEPER